jgi:hypothetical protein
MLPPPDEESRPAGNQAAINTTAKVDTADSSGYASAYGAYRDVGWSPIKLHAGSKFPPPPDFTGDDGIDPSGADCQAWADEEPDGNLAIRLPNNESIAVVGIDVDAYGAKTGGATYAEAVKRWGPLPPGPRSTSRENDPLSGIRLYRVPPGTVLRGQIKFPQLGISDIEICQRHHRYVMSWPSVHPEGRPYWWRNEAMQHIGIPTPGDLPWLPQRWVDGLRVEPHHNGAEVGADIAATLTEGQPSQRVADKFAEAVGAAYGPSRHNVMCGHVLALMRYGNDGEPGVLTAMRTLRDVFVGAVTADGSRTHGEAVAEFNRFITNERAAQLLAVPSNQQWWEDLRQRANEQTASPPVDGEPVDPMEAFIQQRMTVLRAGREANRRLDAEERPQTVPPLVKSLDALLAEPDSPTRYIVDGLMPEGSRIVFAARKKAGKTTASNNLKRSLVDGEPFFGAFAVNTPVRGLVAIDNELSEGMTRRWLRAQGIRNTASVVDVISLRGKVASFDLFDDRCRAYWARRLSDVGCDFLSLDCLRPVLDAFGLDENRDAGKFLTGFDALLVEAAIPNAVVMHHMGHSGERSRGDSSIEGWPDAVWSLVSDGDDQRAPRYFKAFGRDVDVPEGRLTFDPATRRLTYVSESRTDAKVEAAYVAVIEFLAEHARAEGLSQTAVEKGIDDHTRAAVRSALAKSVERGAVATAKGDKRSTLHRIANPCAGCGKPVTVGRERHEECSKSGDRGDK